MSNIYMKMGPKVKLTRIQINKAKEWYSKHEDHLSILINMTKIEEPVVMNVNEFFMWSPGNWLWFVKQTKKNRINSVDINWNYNFCEIYDFFNHFSSCDF